MSSYNSSFSALLFVSCVFILGGCVSDSPIDEKIVATSFSAGEFARACDNWDDWDKPAPPFHIYGGTFHVGTCGISAILITSSEGHLVIDSGTKKGGELVAANIEELGFSLGDVSYLTHTQEHDDHVGGTVYLKNRTQAKMIASPRAQSVFETGYLNTDDPQYVDPQVNPYEPNATLKVDRLISDGETVKLGNKRIIAQFTPGHSPGAVSWTWQECQADQCHTLLFTDGMGPFAATDYRWSNHPEYLTAYRTSLAWLETAEVDICLSAHPSQMRLMERIEKGALVDPEVCSKNAIATQKRIDMIVQKEKEQWAVGNKAN